MADQTRLESLLEKQRKLETQIEEEKVKAQAETVLNSLGANVATVVTAAAKTAKVDISVLHGKFFALTVADGKLSVSVASKATRTANGNGGSNGNGNGNGQYEYFLKDGQGPFADIQTAMDAIGVDKASRPTHNRYDRLSTEWQGKIDRKVKATTEPAATEPATAS